MGSNSGSQAKEAALKALSKQLGFPSLFYCLYIEIPNTQEKFKNCLPFVNNTHTHFYSLDLKRKYTLGRGEPGLIEYFMESPAEH